MKKPVSELPVMKSCCKTCPFKVDSSGRQRDPHLAATVSARTLFNAQQICHGTEGPKREARNRCRGSFDFNNEIYSRMGYPVLK